LVIRMTHQLDYATSGLSLPLLSLTFLDFLSVQCHSGVMCFARTKQAAQRVGKCFEQRLTTKIYLALVWFVLL
jgi:23S rRNA-/tRNA-specific pseudouridylate synthase